MNQKTIVIGDQFIAKYTPNFECPKCGNKVYYHYGHQKDQHLETCDGGNL